MRAPSPWETPQREPAFNLPWPVATLVLALLVAHLARLALHLPPDLYAFTSADLARRHLLPLLTYQFAHGGWPHLGVNSLFIIAFGAPVARWLGSGPRGSLIFFVFFLVCGALAAIGYALASPGQPFALIGASGAASGLMGAATRLIAGRGSLGSIFARRVLTMGLAWLGINVILGFSGLTPGSGGMPVAWQAHVAGFIAGVLLAGIAGRLADAPVHANVG